MHRRPGDTLAQGLAQYLVGPGGLVIGVQQQMGMSLDQPGQQRRPVKIDDASVGARLHGFRPRSRRLSRPARHRPNSKAWRTSPWWARSSRVWAAASTLPFVIRRRIPTAPASSNGIWLMIHLEMTMKKTLALLIPALALSLVTPAAAEDAGKQKKKCGAEATECIREMASKLKQRGWIGIEWNDTDGRPQISLVVAGSPAAKAGVKLGDVVTAFAGVSTDEDEEVVWAAMKRSLVPGKIITLAIIRDGAPRDLEVELIAVPDHIIAQWVGKHVLEHHAESRGDEISKNP